MISKYHLLLERYAAGEITISQAVVGLLTTKNSSILTSKAGRSATFCLHYLGMMQVQIIQPLQQLVLDQYANMLKDADAELLDQAKHMKNMQPYKHGLTDSSIAAPTVSNGGCSNE